MELQWSTHQALVVWVGLWAGVVRSSPGRRLTLSENPGKVLGESRARRKILGVICREFREFQDFCIIGRHRSRVHQSRPENGVM